MKFYTLVLFDSDCLSDTEIEEIVAKQMEPFRLVDDDRPHNHEWKWDYYCLYEKGHMADLGFKEPEFTCSKEGSNYVICEVKDLNLEHMVFAVLTEDGQWLNAPYPLEPEDPKWDLKALKRVKDSKAKYGVYVYCHS